ncbi:MAG: hypothetical protein AAF235_03730, partial [Planctomycetota bacterium]
MTGGWYAMVLAQSGAGLLERLGGLGPSPAGFGVVGLMLAIIAVAGAFIMLPNRRRSADRVQRSLPFKIGSTCVVAALCAGWIVTTWISVERVRMAADTEIAELLGTEVGEVSIEVLQQGGAIAAIGVLAVVALLVVSGIIWIGSAITYVVYGSAAAAAAVIFVILGQPDLAFVAVGVAGLSMAFVVLMNGLR